MSKKRSPIGRLAQLIPPPENPVESGPMTLRPTIERTLGLALPDDLYDFAMVYGTGRFVTSAFSGLLQIANPFSPGFAEEVADQASMCRQIKKAEGDSYIPYWIYPERPGLLSLGSDENGRLVFWLTEGEPDHWSILVWTLERQFRRSDKSLTEFLYQLFSGKIDCWGSDKPAKWFKTHRKELSFDPDVPIHQNKGPRCRGKWQTAYWTLSGLLWNHLVTMPSLYKSKSISENNLPLK